jgi:toxin secretion/phage lysis holin
MNGIKFILGLGISGITYLLGGFDMAIQVLIIAIAIDYLTGIMKAISKKELNSYIGWKGFMKKIAMMMGIIIAYQFECLFSVEGLRNVVAYGFVVNEGISILENMNELGVKIPALRKFLKKFKDKEGDDDESND